MQEQTPKPEQNHRSRHELGLLAAGAIVAVVAGMGGPGEGTNDSHGQGHESAPVATAVPNIVTNPATRQEVVFTIPEDAEQFANDPNAVQQRNAEIPPVDVPDADVNPHG